MQGVPQRDRLAEDVVRTELGAAPVPVAPLVDDEARAVLGVVAGHDGPVVVHHLLDADPLVQDGVPALFVELRPVLRRLTEVRVVMQGEAVGADAQAADVLQPGEEPLRPAYIAIGGMAAGPGRHEERAQVDGNLRDVLAVFGGVFSAGHVTAATPRFVAYAPVLDAERFPVAICGALSGK